MVEAKLLLLGALALVVLVVIFSFVARGTLQQPPPLQSPPSSEPSENVRIPSGLQCGATSPFSLAYWKLTPDGTLVLVPCNNAPDSLTLKGMSLQDGYGATPLKATLPITTLAPGQVSANPAVFKVKSCNEGDTRSFSQITFNYDSQTNPNLKQVGSRDLIVRCG